MDPMKQKALLQFIDLLSHNDNPSLKRVTNFEDLNTFQHFHFILRRNDNVKDNSDNTASTSSIRPDEFSPLSYSDSVRNLLLSMYNVPDLSKLHVDYDRALHPFRDVVELAKICALVMHDSIYARINETREVCELNMSEPAGLEIMHITTYINDVGVDDPNWSEILFLSRKEADFHWDEKHAAYAESFAFMGNVTEASSAIPSATTSTDATPLPLPAKVSRAKSQTAIGDDLPFPVSAARAASMSKIRADAYNEALANCEFKEDSPSSFAMRTPGPVRSIRVGNARVPSDAASSPLDSFFNSPSVKSKTKERQTIQQLRVVQAHRDELQLKVDELEREVGELRTAKDSKDCELRRQTIAKEALQRQCREFATKSDTPTKDNMHAEIQKLKVELSELRDVECSLERTTRDLQTANGEIHRIQSSAAQLRDKLADKERIIEKREKELAEQMTVLEQATTDKEQLEKKFLDLQSKMRDANDELASRSIDVKKLQQADVRWKKACDEANARTMEVEESLRVAQANRETKQADWETERESLLAVISDLQTKTSEAENRIEDLQKSKSALESRCEDFDAANGVLSSQNSDMQQRINSLELEMFEKAEEIVAKSSEWKEIEEDLVEQLDETRRGAERSEAEFEHTIEQMTRDNDELKLRMTELRDANQQTRNDNTVLRVHIEAIESERDTLRCERDDALTSLEDQDATIGEMKNQLHSQSSELHQQRIDNEDLVQERNAAVESCQQTTVRVGLLEAQLEEANSRYQALEEEHSSLKMHNEFVVVDNNKNEECLTELQQQLTEIRTSKDDAEKLCQEKEDLIQKQSAQICELEASLLSTREEHDAMTNELQGRLIQLSALREEELARHEDAARVAANDQEVVHGQVLAGLEREKKLEQMLTDSKALFDEMGRVKVKVEDAFRVFKEQAADKKKLAEKDYQGKLDNLKLKMFHQDKAIAARKELQSKLIEKEAVITSLHADITARDEDIAQLNLDLEKLRAEHQVLKIKQQRTFQSTGTRSHSALVDSDGFRMPASSISADRHSVASSETYQSVASATSSSRLCKPHAVDLSMDEPDIFMSRHITPTSSNKDRSIVFSQTPMRTYSYTSEVLQDEHVAPLKTPTSIARGRHNSCSDTTSNHTPDAAQLAELRRRNLMYPAHLRDSYALHTSNIIDLQPDVVTGAADFVAPQSVVEKEKKRQAAKQKDRRSDFLSPTVSSVKGFGGRIRKSFMAVNKRHQQENISPSRPLPVKKAVAFDIPLDAQDASPAAVTTNMKARRASKKSALGSKNA